jgi:hypothetical protein
VTSWIGLRAPEPDGAPGNWKIALSAWSITAVAAAASEWLHHALQDREIHERAIRELRAISMGNLNDRQLGALMQFANPENLLIQGNIATPGRLITSRPGICVDFWLDTISLHSNLSEHPVPGGVLPGSTEAAFTFSRATAVSKLYLKVEETPAASSACGLAWQWEES